MKKIKKREKIKKQLVAGQTLNKLKTTAERKWNFIPFNSLELRQFSSSPIIFADVFSSKRRSGSGVENGSKEETSKCS